jgi:hypothetical protein
MNRNIKLGSLKSITHNILIETQEKKKACNSNKYDPMRTVLLFGAWKNELCVINITTVTNCEKRSEFMNLHDFHSLAAAKPIE